MKFNLVSNINEVAITADLLIQNLEDKTEAVMCGEKLLKENGKNILLARQTSFNIHKQAKKCNGIKQKLLLRCLGQCVACIHTTLHIRGVNLYLAKLNEME